MGLDPLTPAIAIARATRPDQAVVSGPIGELPQRLAQADLPGPLLVMLGHSLGDQVIRTSGNAGAPAERSTRIVTDRHLECAFGGWYLRWRWRHRLCALNEQ